MCVCRSFTSFFFNVNFVTAFVLFQFYVLGKNKFTTNTCVWKSHLNFLLLTLTEYTQSLCICFVLSGCMWCSSSSSSRQTVTVWQQQIAVFQKVQQFTWRYWNGSLFSCSNFLSSSSSGSNSKRMRQKCIVWCDMAAAVDAVAVVDRFFCSFSHSLALALKRVNEWVNNTHSKKMAQTYTHTQMALVFEVMWWWCRCCDDDDADGW